MPRISQPKLILLPAVPMCCLLTGCFGFSTFSMAPYYVGVRSPQTKSNTGEYTHTRTTKPGSTFDCGIYRIGADYYAKTDVYYFPHKAHTKFFWQPFGDYNSPAPGIDYDRTPVRRTRFCRLNAGECKQLGLPVLEGASGSPAELTAQEAAKLNPVYVCTRQTKDMPASLNMEDKYTWAHYALIPVTAATFVAVDVPLSIIGGGAVLTVMALCEQITHPSKP